MDGVKFFCIFCDDIRQELGGKISYMGVYSNAINFPSLPFVLPQFVISVRAVGNVEKLDGSASILIDLNGPQQVIPIKIERSGEGQPEKMDIHTVCFPLSVTEPGVFKVYLAYGGEKELLDQISVGLGVSAP